ncbi:DUF6415 family natural product biosynthesis protein [Streptomyces sp. NPDC008222]|uniref:DUF6415 family natural product biosynthesis protein n=1 Tax=Streptomyces sp. NPDC008222 TaxID=3364820 RepID=UPI0036E001A9
MTPLAAPAVDARLIRRTYGTALWDSRPVGEESRAHMAGLLRGHMRLLLPEDEKRVAAMPGTFNRSAGQHVIARAHDVLDVPVTGASSAEYVYDLATLTRVLLALHERPQRVGVRGVGGGGRRG